MNLTPEQQNKMIAFLIPLSGNNHATITFGALPVAVKDVLAMKKWLDLFCEAITEEKCGGRHNPPPPPKKNCNYWQD